MIFSAAFSKPGKNCEKQLGMPYVRIKIRYRNTNSGPAWFAEFFTKTQVFHKKFSRKEMEDFWENNAGKTFFNCIARTEDKEISVLANKKGHITRLEKKLIQSKPNPLSSDTKKGTIPENSTEINNPAASSGVCCPQKVSQSGFNTLLLRPKGRGIKPSARIKRIPCACNGSAQFGFPKKTDFNRTKKYILQEEIPVPFLIHLGIMNEQGKVLSSKYNKFRQINRFLEYIDDILPDVIMLIKKETQTGQNEPLPRPIRIADFGCGKSYLTFAVHYWLTQIKNYPVEITGLDLKEDVISYCNTLAKQFKCSGLRFAVGNIAEYSYERTPDIVITLHACNTATDYALNYAVKHNAKAILSVPCCQHELNKQIGEWKKSTGNDKVVQNNTNPFETLLHYGIIRERFAALATDALRAEYLENKGYKVQILEFIDMTHTPKNLLIRAVARNGTAPASSDKNPTTTQKAAKARAELLTDALHVSPTLRELLQD